ncbi:DUF7319 domain-containing protein [Halapricum hydrolyticum]|uniref:DUF7319 domain-containing protein n=1 Tax=Halapricum hydrolyticum TaxID=2979991 RepID=A0AAE3LHW8_9EURY|nr:hypothetical protein [Halapricum hydrolyticum]MCU4719129.1 hypothetical protein [Halapricum hydrolyticum]MCU4727319.1 hypothetical protein [Halapricum hydrolyticum]
MDASGSTPPDPDESATSGDEPGDESSVEDGELSTEQLRERVEQKYDFDDFGPRDMAEMTAEEWEVAFDADSWITGQELLDRVEADLKQRVLDRDAFARIERGEDYLLAYSETGFALVYPDGSVEGEGTVLRDVKPVIALCSMDDYDAPDVPDGEILPEPQDVPEGGSELGNLMVQAIAIVQLLAGVILLGAGIVLGMEPIPLVAGLGFLVIGVGLLFVVANARLSDRFRSEEFRDRLRAVNVGGERPDFLPVDEDGNLTSDRSDGERETVLPPSEHDE